jgi:cytochrome c5
MKDQGFEHAHSSPIKTWQQLVVVTVLAFVIPVMGLILLAQFVISGYRAAQTAADPDTVARRIQPVARVEFADAAPSGGARAAKSGEEVYKAVCAACHGTGAANAPKTGDKAAWAPLIKEGFDTLVKDAINGVRAMPPRGGNPDLSDVEVARAVAYLANQAGANWKEPAAPATPAAAKPAAAAPAATPVAAAPAALPAKVYFDVGKAALTADGKTTVAAAAATLQSVGDKVDVTGYTDRTGNLAKNLELAKDRAKAVREALVAGGIAQDRINMKPPIETTGTGTDKEARRVEVALAGQAAATVAAAPAARAEDKGKATYAQACVACHGQGVAGAPKFGDKAAWAPRIKNGVDALYATSLKGKGAMPPKGGNAALADADVKAAVDYMVATAK